MRILMRRSSSLSVIIPDVVPEFAEYDHTNALPYRRAKLDLQELECNPSFPSSCRWRFTSQ